MNLLTQDLLHEVFEYHDGALYWKVNKGSRARIGDKVGSLQNRGYLSVRLNKKLYLTHRLIYLYHNGVLPEFIDHINGNKLDNHIENLRPATLAQNGFNAKLSNRNTSGVKGVSWNKRYNKWEAYLNKQNKRTCLGSFSSLEEATNAVTKARENHHKEFARYE